ncbi:MAG TPA: ferritin-like domain-containing protein [Pseudonocardia sp.]
MTSTATLIRQLRAVLALTQTEAQIARTRVAQARTDAVRRELTQNADNADRRSRQIVAELRTLGGVPDVVTPIVGRFTAVLKSTLEQATPFDEALLQDLALEQQLQGRARYLKSLAEAAGRPSTKQLAERLEAAHTETIDWITIVLAEEALGGPAALRATPFQRFAGGATLVVNVPSRFAREQLNRAVDRVRGVAGHTRDAVDDVTDKAATLGRDARDVLSTGRDAALQRAETVARRDGADGTADTLHSARRELGALTSDELPIEGFDGLGAQDAVKQIKTLTGSDDIRAIVRYEETHKDRANVVSAAQARLADIAREVAGVS